MGTVVSVEPTFQLPTCWARVKSRWIVEVEEKALGPILAGHGAGLRAADAVFLPTWVGYQVKEFAEERAWHPWRPRRRFRAALIGKMVCVERTAPPVSASGVIF
jgi:hypothetical protein